VTLFADWQGKWEDALKDAKMLDGRVGMHVDEAIKDCGGMEGILGGVPALEVKRLLEVCQKGCERGAKKEREVFEKMFQRRGNMGMPGDYAGAEEAGREEDVGEVQDGVDEEVDAGISNVVRSMKAFRPESAREGEGPYVMVEMDGGESKEGRAMRLRDEEREREKAKAAVERGRQKEERERGEREMAKSRDRGVDGDLFPPRNVPCHVSSVYGGSALAGVADIKRDVLEREVRSRDQEREREMEREREREKVDRAEGGVGGGGGSGGGGGGGGGGGEVSLEVEEVAKEADAVWIELQHPLMQACDALRRGKRGVVGGGIVGFAESMMHIHEGLKDNMRQADEMVSDLRLRAASGGREVEEGVVTAGERALRYKGEVCMDLCAKVEALMDPHADPDQVLVVTPNRKP
jgi:hypothetical protein